MGAELSGSSALEWQPARQSLVADVTDSEVDLAFRARALELGFWLGWLAIAAALSGLAFDTWVGTALARSRSGGRRSRL
jgi:hypothetical protein